MNSLAVAQILGGLFAAWAAGWSIGVSVAWVRKLRNVA